MGLLALHAHGYKLQVLIGVFATFYSFDFPAPISVKDTAAVARDSIIFSTSSFLIFALITSLVRWSKCPGLATHSPSRYLHRHYTTATEDSLA